MSETAVKETLELDHGEADARSAGLVRSDHPELDEALDPESSRSSKSRSIRSWRPARSTRPMRISSPSRRRRGQEPCAPESDRAASARSRAWGGRSSTIAEPASARPTAAGSVRSSWFITSLSSRTWLGWPTSSPWVTSFGQGSRHSGGDRRRGQRCTLHAVRRVLLRPPRREPGGVRRGAYAHEGRRALVGEADASGGVVCRAGLDLARCAATRSRAPRGKSDGHGPTTRSHVTQDRVRSRRIPRPLGSRQGLLVPSPLRAHALLPRAPTLLRHGGGRSSGRQSLWSASSSAIRTMPTTNRFEPGTPLDRPETTGLRSSNKGGQRWRAESLYTSA